LNRSNLRRASRRILLSATALLTASCATVVRAPSGIEAERLLPPGAAVYARLDKATLSAAILSMPGGDARSAASIADRTDTMTAAFLAPTRSSAGGLVAVAEGRYPAGAASMRLSSDPAWRRSGPVWERTDGSMSLAFASGGRAFFGTAPLDGLLAASIEPNPDPIPARWADEWKAAVAIYLPDPMTALRSRLPLGDGAVPMLAIMLSARPSPGSDYIARLSFEFATERAAVVFAPLCRLFLYAAATSLWPERSATVMDAVSWTTDGAIVTASGIPLDAAALASFAGVAGL
jgi:hypothetical protein